MSKNKKTEPGKTKPEEQPKKDAKSEESVYHPTKGGYAQDEEPVTKDATLPADFGEPTKEKWNKLEEKIQQSQVKEPISRERWMEAQKAEYEAHERDTRNTFQHYKGVYNTYLKYVECGHDLHGLHVIEVGPAHHPALAYCHNYGASAIVEPMHNEKLFEFCRANSVSLFDMPLEEISDEDLNDFRDNAEGNVIEVWLFNVMQHVINPDEFIRQCKLFADRIRFFEPINTPVEPHHPHTFTYQNYIDYFGGCVKMYKGGTELNFHTADCAYGVWIRPSLQNV